MRVHTQCIGHMTRGLFKVNFNTLLTRIFFKLNTKLYMNGKDVEVVGECVHLGIHRVSKSRYTKMLKNAFSLPGGALKCCMGAWLGYTLAKLGSYVFPLQCGTFSYYLVCCMALISCF